MVLAATRAFILELFLWFMFLWITVTDLQWVFPLSVGMVIFKNPYIYSLIVFSELGDLRYSSIN